MIFDYQDVFAGPIINYPDYVFDAPPVPDPIFENPTVGGSGNNTTIVIGSIDGVN